MRSLGDWIARDVITIAKVSEGNKTLEDLGIMELTPGTHIVECRDVQHIDMDKLKPLEGFTRDEIYRKSMLERDGLIAGLEGLVNGLLNALLLGARSGEGISRAWCRELYDGYSERHKSLIDGEA